MPFVQVQTYRSSLTRAIVPGGARTIPTVRMMPEPGVGAGSNVAFIEFMYTDAASNLAGEAPDQRVFGFFPPSEFPVHREMLQSEAPVIVEWATDPSNQPFLNSITLRTSSEPVGQGPADP